MTALATYFSKSKLMAWFQWDLCIGFHKKEDIIVDLEVPDDVLCIYLASLRVTA